MMDRQQSGEHIGNCDATGVCSKPLIKEASACCAECDGVCVCLAKCDVGMAPGGAEVL